MAQSPGLVGTGREARRRRPAYPAVSTTLNQRRRNPDDASSRALGRAPAGRHGGDDGNFAVSLDEQGETGTASGPGSADPAGMAPGRPAATSVTIAIARTPAARALTRGRMSVARPAIATTSAGADGISAPSVAAGNAWRCRPAPEPSTMAVQFRISRLASSRQARRRNRGGRRRGHNPHDRTGGRDSADGVGPGRPPPVPPDEGGRPSRARRSRWRSPQAERSIAGTAHADVPGRGRSVSAMAPPTASHATASAPSTASPAAAAIRGRIAPGDQTTPDATPASAATPHRRANPASPRRAARQRRSSTRTGS